MPATAKRPSGVCLSHAASSEASGPAGFSSGGGSRACAYGGGCSVGRFFSRLPSPCGYIPDPGRGGGPLPPCDIPARGAGPVSHSLRHLLPFVKADPPPALRKQRLTRRGGTSNRSPGDTHRRRRLRKKNLTRENYIKPDNVPGPPVGEGALCHLLGISTSADGARGGIFPLLQDGRGRVFSPPTGGAEQGRGAPLPAQREHIRSRPQGRNAVIKAALAGVRLLANLLHICGKVCGYP